MVEQRKKLKELLNETAIEAVGAFIRNQISRAHPGCDTDLRFNPALDRISLGYWAPKPYRDLCLIIDSSGSVRPDTFRAIGEGANEAFQANLGDGQRRDYSVVNFSNNTLFSGWVPKTQSILLESITGIHQGDGTILDPTVVARLSDGNRRFAALMVTDGVLQNAYSAIPALHEMVRKGNKLSVIYFGESGLYNVKQMAEFANVLCINDGEKIKLAMRDYAKTALKQ